MRTARLLFWPVLLAILLRVADAATAPSSTPAVAKLGFFIGDVRCRTGAGPWSPAKLNQPLHAQQELRTGPESRAELQLGSSVVRLGERSVLRLADLKLKGDAAEGGLQLLFGQLWSRLRNLGDEGLELRSPTAVMAVRGTIFRAEAGVDSSVALWVYEGRVDMGNAHQKEEDSTNLAAPAPPTG